jgi:nucleoside-diphosphate-sugar epimerase
VRIFLAGAGGVIGRELLPLLVADGHIVEGMTRTASGAEAVRELGAQPLILDVFDADALCTRVAAFAPDLVMHQLTDLPDDAAKLGGHAGRNDRIRTEGTRNLLGAAAAAGATRFLAQSIAWTPARGGAAVAEHERLVLAAGGVVLRYGQLYGPGTWYEGRPPDPPRVSVGRAARDTLALLDAPAGVVEIID